MTWHHLALLGLLALPACADTATAPRQQSSTGVALALGAGKPLSTLTFDELPEVQDLFFGPLDVNGVRFEFVTVAEGLPTHGAYYGDGCPDREQLQGRCLRAEAQQGKLIITFDKPTQMVQFGFYVSSPEINYAMVDVIGPSGKSRGVFTTGTEARFTYDKNAVSRLVIRFQDSHYRFFYLDNLVYHTAPR